MALTKKTKQVPKKKFGTKKKTLKRYNKTQKGGKNGSEAKAQRAAEKAAKAEKAAAKAAAAAAAANPGKAESTLFNRPKPISSTSSNKNKTFLTTKPSFLQQLFGRKTLNAKPVPQPNPFLEQTKVGPAYLAAAEQRSKNLRGQATQYFNKYGITSDEVRNMEGQMERPTTEYEQQKFIKTLQDFVDTKIMSGLEANSRQYYTGLSPEVKEKFREEFGSIGQSSSLSTANKISGANPTLPTIRQNLTDRAFYERLRSAFPESIA
jgi:hypothetical protein